MKSGCASSQKKAQWAHAIFQGANAALDSPLIYSPAFISGSPASVSGFGGW